MKKVGWRIFPIVFLLLLGIFFWRGLSLDPHYLPSVQIGKKLPAFVLPQLLTSEQFSSSQLPHQVVLINVWASWCAACMEEQAFLLKLAAEGVPVYGLNYKDQPAAAKQWLMQWGNPYKIIMQDKQGKTAIDLGVYGAPETFIIDKQGIIRYRHAGILNQTLWSKEILPVIQQWEKA